MAETYADYVPQKCKWFGLGGIDNYLVCNFIVIRFRIFCKYLFFSLGIGRDGKPHPDPIVETASLSGVSMPDISHTLSIPKAVINQGLLSAPQLEAIVYACQQHEFFLASGERAGYLIGTFF